MTTWRLLLDDAADGEHNMALDAALLDAHAAGESPPSLRLYTWRRPTVSLGRFQPLTEVDVQACVARGIEVVRRPTGGRGVLHDDELTYAVIAGRADGIPRGVSASYRYLALALADAYRRLGLDAAVGQGAAGEGRSAACYLQSTRADLALGTAKLSGSAQVWRADSVLQHGSFVVSRDVDAEAAVFRLDAGERQRLARSAITLQDALGSSPLPDAVRTAIIQAFESRLGITLVQGSLLPSEEERLVSRLTVRNQGLSEPLG